MNGYFSALLRSSGVVSAPTPAAHEPSAIEPPPIDAGPDTTDAWAAPPEPHSAAHVRAVTPPSTQPVPPMAPVAPAPHAAPVHATPAPGTREMHLPTGVADTPADTRGPAVRTERPPHREPPPLDAPAPLPRAAPAVPPAEALLQAARRWVAADPALAVRAPVVMAPAADSPAGRVEAPHPLSYARRAEPAAAPQLAAFPTPPLRGPDPPAPRIAALARDDARQEAPPRSDHAWVAPNAGAVEVSIGAIHVTVDAPPPVSLQAPPRTAAPAPAHIAPRSTLARRSLRRI